MKAILRVLICLILAAPSLCSAVVFGGSNLDFTGYPEFTEVAPTPPYTNDQYSWDNYRQEVAAYTAKAKQYLEDANSDIQRIQEAQQDAISKANTVVQEFNSQSR